LAAYIVANRLLSGTCVFCGTDPPIDVIQGNAGVVLPPSAREFRGYTEGFQDILTMARFTIDPTDLPLFLESTACNSALAAIDPGGIPSLEGHPDWWRPMDASTLMTCDGVRGPDHHTVYVDQSTQDAYIVYIVASVY
jgi:hypothetical protein